MDEYRDFNLIFKTSVDGESWYTVSCQREISIWLRKSFVDQENKQWFQHIDDQWHINYNIFDIDERIYTVLALRWS